MATKSKRHVHKYHKILFSFAKVWACALPDCLHYMPQHMEKMAEGKATLCWGCNEQMILTPINMTDDKPLCITCKRKEVELLQSRQQNQDINEDTEVTNDEGIGDFLREKGLA